MDKKLKTKWIKALRSGKYKQCRTILTDGKGYCCIGVLGEISGDVDQGYDIASAQFGDKNSAFLQDMNDGGRGMKKHGFKAIATWIEKNL